jgi:hypothetical protein
VIQSFDDCSGSALRYDFPAIEIAFGVMSRAGQPRRSALKFSKHATRVNVDPRFDRIPSTSERVHSCNQQGEAAKCGARIGVP